jgi:hypothetical protein
MVISNNIQITFKIKYLTLSGSLGNSNSDPISNTKMHYICINNEFVCNLNNSLNIQLNIINYTLYHPIVIKSNKKFKNP